MRRSGPPGRRTPLARGPGPARRTPLDRSGPPPRRSGPPSPTGRRAPLRGRSEAREALYAADRRPRVERLAAAGVGCLIGPMLRAAGVDPVLCSGRLEGLHERRKRSAGGSLVNPENLIPACNWCNGWVEDEPAAARELFGSGLVVREGDEAWPRLGSRADRAGAVGGHDDEPPHPRGAWRLGS